ncbi:oxygen-independent coproporphyrinogen III oxidase [Chitiniphilus purpureus]|uniref:Coproporphyrinogen-III oxidase n=1 Tax=Chitiniphilus purpureus TaxID=2981137 RepID=A0ABY6DS72_9NEIS|nr:oxygen-independent coproporphyrinogen III oxidase [Chitiniphilus sp. CD1]UXY17182.1 oxygen-independent coproporphyrinogen III oxidase [Chitiniphilus sp. CD1]
MESYTDLQRAVFDRGLIERYDGHGPRYTSYPTADRFADFDAQRYNAAIEERQPGSAAKPLSLYFHLPFCDTICYYCACNKVITKDRGRTTEYLSYLKQEIALAASLLKQRGKVWQLHLGGGTPTFFSDGQLGDLLAYVHRYFELQDGGEYSIEIDPRKVSSASIRALAGLGFNRMSVGVQDFDPQVQLAVNRVQSEEQTRAVIDEARAAGFASVSVDLIYGLPLQSQASVHRTIERIVALRPDRIALYNYAHLPQRFAPQRRIDEASLPAASVKLDILGDSIQALQEAGYLYIGMDHFALPEDDLAVAQRRGRLHRNFQGYSTYADSDLLGFGVSAIGLVGPVYAQNAKTLDAYYGALAQGRLPTTRGLVMNRDDLIRRTVIQTLMCQFRLSYAPLEISYMIDFPTYFAEELSRLAAFAADGLLQFTSDGLEVTARGRMLVRAIAMVFDCYLKAAPRPNGYSRLI